MPINVLIADDHTIVREGVKCILDNTGDIDVIGRHQTDMSALTQLTR